MFLHDLLSRSSRSGPARVAVREVSGAEIRYDELDALSDRARDRLARLGVRPGDRVGLCL